MILAVDVGNTHTNLGLFEGDELAASWTLSTRKQTTPDEVLVALAGVMSLRGHAAQDALAVDGAVLSCVVPDLAPAWRAVLARVSGERPLVVGPGLKTGLKMKYNDPGEIGSDRIADLVAAKECHGAPVVVVDLGTTTNFEVLDDTGAFVGGIIAPGLDAAARAVSREAARLPEVEVRPPRSVIGKNTREAMQAGIVLGEAARIDGLVDLIWAELGYETKVVATGDGADSLAAISKRIGCTDPALTLAGLNLLYRRNRG